MARLRHSQEADSIFPYLSVLLCFIGALLLGVLLVSAGRLALRRQFEERQSNWKEYTEIRRQLAPILVT